MMPFLVLPLMPLAVANCKMFPEMGRRFRALASAPREDLSRLVSHFGMQHGRRRQLSKGQLVDTSSVDYLML